MSGQKWNWCLSVWIGKSQRILAWSFLTTFSGSTHQSLLCSRLYSAHMVLSLSVLGSRELAEATDNMCRGLYMLLAHPASGILHSVVDLVCYCLGVEGLLLSCHNQSFGGCYSVVFIDPLLCAGYICNFWHTSAPDVIQRLLIAETLSWFPILFNQFGIVGPLLPYLKVAWGSFESSFHFLRFVHVSLF